MGRLSVVVSCILCMASLESKADTYSSAMIGVFNSAKNSKSEVKSTGIGYRDDLGFGLKYGIELGGWIDIAGQGRSSSGYGSYQIGLEAGDSTLARVMVGPAFITTPDSYLGGYFQMTEDFFLGIKGKNGNIIGVKYKHFSSGGLEQPNVGRDLAGVEASIPF